MTTLSKGFRLIKSNLYCLVGESYVCLRGSSTMPQSLLPLMVKRVISQHKHDRKKTENTQ